LTGNYKWGVKIGDIGTVVEYSGSYVYVVCFDDLTTGHIGRGHNIPYGHALLVYSRDIKKIQ